ncbi:MAG TPA: AAA family ATPase, partial [Opitutaceae bacterium]
MAEIKRTTLFGKLNTVGYKSIEAATVFCKMRGNPYVESVHWIHQILQQPDSDLLRIVKHFGLDSGRLATDLVTSLDRLPRGATAISDFSPHIETALQQAWIYSTLLFGDGQVRTGYLAIASLKTPDLRNAFVGLSREFGKIKLEALTDEFSKIVAGSPEDALGATDGTGFGAGATPGEASGVIPFPEMGKQEALRRFTSDLTERARKGGIDPIIGRDDEIRQCVDILMRRRQNNPILTGEAGVGKTAVVDGFALRIVAGDVPPALRNVVVRSLDIGLLQAGASMKGEFEQRLRGVIDEVQASATPIILFIDEVHMLIGAGGAAGTGDAANLLKPALARGTLRTLAATTWKEYKKYIEKDLALTRRFQVVKIEEPDEAKCIRMMRAVVAPFENHHRIQILDEAIEAAVRLSHRYIAERQLPDKAVSLIDTASARVAVSQHAVPAAVDDCRRRIQMLDTEIGILGRETSVGFDHEARLGEVRANLAREQEALAALEKHWGEEKELVGGILGLRAKLRGVGVAPDETLKSGLPATPESASGAARVADAPTPATATTATVTPAASATADAKTNGELPPEERAKLLGELKGLQDRLRERQGES